MTITSKKRIYVLIAFIVICIFLFLFLLAKLVQVNNRCVEDPFVYAANTIVNQKGEVLYSLCSCEVVEAQETFFFDNKGLYAENPLTNSLKN